MKIDRTKYKGTKIWINTFHFQMTTLSWELNHFNQYIKDARLLIDKHKNEFESRIEEYVKNDPEGREEIYDFHHEDFQMYSTFYPFILHNSTFLALYSFFESNLKDICSTFEKMYSSKQKLFEVKKRKDDITHMKKFITDIIGLDLSELEAHHCKMTDYRETRNLIIHHYSSFKPDKKESSKDYSFIQNDPRLLIDDKNERFVIKDDRYITDFSKLVEDYLRIVYKQALEQLDA